MNSLIKLSSPEPLESCGAEEQTSPGELALKAPLSYQFINIDQITRYYTLIGCWKRCLQKFTPGAGLQMEKKAGPSAADKAIASASSLAEVERLKGLLQAGQIPGRGLQSGDVEEEEEEEVEMAEPVSMYEENKDEEMEEEMHVNGS
ncbi:hypothetical protein DNTS_012042 [Danionella cerebrum]|uniref:Uncharacterized protein n=1 Tax=Danionella cerebrum TaxID=2873325 RepID=A0A553MX78_9TELE|nr:hypothetical protein DNTS_012042 [Danionella translucida]